ncbi:MAG: 3-hydroxyacyl-CoA dehydrogenase NAD-binding domain-containing protein [Chitinophagaceae bacterium]
MNITTVCVCGAGTMGSGIAQVCAAAGFPVVLYELNSTVLDRAKLSIEEQLQKAVEKGKIEATQKKTILNRILFNSDLHQCKADLVIEAIAENAVLKIELFQQLAAINSSQTVFATNTSSLSVSVLAEKLPVPEQMAGLHFFNPAPLMKLVEVVRGNRTSDAVVQTLTAFARVAGKMPVVCTDAPGFIVNRVARPFYLEALRLVEEGAAPLETIDRLLEKQGFKLGPFRLMDLIGNDINYAVTNSVYDRLAQPFRLLPSSIQKEKVEQGALGRKTGKGFYEYR